MAAINYLAHIYTDKEIKYNRCYHKILPYSHADYNAKTGNNINHTLSEPLSLIQKFLMCASLHIQTLQSTVLHNPVSTQSKKWLCGAVYATFLKIKRMYLRIRGSCKSQNDGFYKSLFRKSAKCHFCGRSASLTNHWSSQIYLGYLRTAHHYSLHLQKYINCIIRISYICNPYFPQKK